MSQNIGQNLPQALTAFAQYAKEEGRGAIWYHVMDQAYMMNDARACFEAEWGLPPFKAINDAGERSKTTHEFNAAADAYREYMTSFKVYMTAALGLEEKAPLRIKQWAALYKDNGITRFDEQFGPIHDRRSAADAIATVPPRVK